jgi:gamma-glutamyl-gamma-aminobutyrate hydrolase PuuD
MLIASVTYVDHVFGRSYLARKAADILPNTDLVVLWGGTDISPMIYGQKNVASETTDHPTDRDLREIEIIDTARQRNIPILGICRGAQLLCAVDGGRLWQHVSGHAGPAHYITMNDGSAVATNSAHHQLMVPGDNAEVLGVAANVLSPYKIGEQGETQDTSPEAEVVYFPRYNALGIQGHPEWLADNHDLRKLTRKLMKEYFDVAVS